MKGWSRVEQETKAQEENRREMEERRKEWAVNAANRGNPLYSAAIKRAGGTIVARPLEQGNEGPEAINVFEMHEYRNPARQYPDRETCLHEIHITDCPMCKGGLPIKVRTVINLIWRNAPILQRGQDGKLLRGADNNFIIVGYEDQVFYWEVSNTTGELLRRLDNKYGGLMSRDWEISWTGVTTNPYALEPAEVDAGPQPMSENDRALAAKKHNLDEIYKPPSVQEAAGIVAKYGANSGANSTAQGIPNAVPSAQDNPMMRGVQVPAGSAFAAAQQGQK